MKTYQPWLIIFMLLALTGCGTSQPQSGNESPGESTDFVDATPKSILSTQSTSSISRSGPLPATTPASNTVTTVIITPDANLQSLAKKALVDLAAQLGVEVETVELDRIVPAVWPYDSTGCPLPEGYETSESPGYQILLIHANQIYAYHTDGGNLLVFCDLLPLNEIRTLP